MKALSIHPEYAMNIVKGLKTVEIRGWTTRYRGDLLICATAKNGRGLVSGHALGIVNLSDIVPMDRSHARAAMVDPGESWFDCYAWILENPRPIKPFPIKGKLSLWTCDHEIEMLPAPAEPHALRSYCEKYWDDFLHGRNISKQESGPARIGSETAAQEQAKPFSDTSKKKTSGIEGTEREKQASKAPAGRSAQSEVRMDTIKVINNITVNFQNN